MGGWPSEGALGRAVGGGVCHRLWRFRFSALRCFDVTGRDCLSMEETGDCFPVRQYVTREEILNSLINAFWRRHGGEVFAFRSWEEG